MYVLSSFHDGCAMQKRVKGPVHQSLHSVNGFVGYHITVGKSLSKSNL